MDSDLNLNSHIKAIRTSANPYLKNLLGTEGIIAQKDLEKLAHVFKSTQLL